MFLIRLPDISTELELLQRLSLVSPQSLPLLPTLLRAAGGSGPSPPESTAIVTTCGGDGEESLLSAQQSSPQIAALLESVLSRFSLNDDQAAVLRFCCGWFKDTNGMTIGRHEAVTAPDEDAGASR